MQRWIVIRGIASTLFVALILTFGLPPEIASAHGNHDELCTGPHKKDPGCDGDDSGKPAERHDLLFEPVAGPTGSGLLTLHTDTGVFDYTTRSNSGCPIGSSNAEWGITSVKTSSPGVFVYTADGPDLIIDLLAAGVGLDGCFGATAVDNGLFTLELRKNGRGQNTSCEARVLWNFNYTSQTDYLSMQSDGWILLATPPFDQCDKRSQSSILIDGQFLFSETTAGGGAGDPSALWLSFFVVFQQSSD